MPKAQCISVASSVTRLGEISPFERYFLALSAFFLINIAQMIQAQTQKSSRFWLVLVIKFPNFDFCGQKFLFSKAPFRAIFDKIGRIF
jgi:hypothetical protein